MTGEAYAIGRDLGAKSRRAVLRLTDEPLAVPRVMRKHRDAMRDVTGAQRAVGSLRAAKASWARCGGA